MGAEERAVWRAARRERDDLLARLRRDPGSLEATSATRGVVTASTGIVDQAGRWGMLVPGASSELERRLFARSIVRTGEATPERVRRLLLLPAPGALIDRDDLNELDELIFVEQQLLDVEPDTTRPDMRRMSSNSWNSSPGSCASCWHASSACPRC